MSCTLYQQLHIMDEFISAHMNMAQISSAQISVAQVILAHINVAQMNLAQLSWFICTGSNKFGSYEHDSYDLAQMRQRRSKVLYKIICVRSHA